MMLFLRDYETFPARACLQADPETFEIEYDCVVGVKDVLLDVNIQKSGDEYFCQGEVRAVIQLECVRCLTPFDSAVESKIDFIVCPESLHAEYSKDAVDSEDYVYLEGDEMRADVTEMARQAIILAVPMKPVCSESCRGLCPKCGVNRNETDCGCDQQPTDERWEGLRDLLNR